MKFRTYVEIPEAGFKISHNSRCVFTGSCFAENIGNKVKELKIPTLVNPTGIHYNPSSIAESVKMAISSKQISEENLFEANGLFNHYNFHSDFSDTDKTATVKKMNKSLELLRQSLINADYFFVTFGTSFIYTLADSIKIVTNCHKLPEKNFIRIFLGLEETVAIWKSLLNELKTINPNLKIVFTVSPVRHFRDGATQNQQSKSALLLAIKELVETNMNIYYFPAYEIMNDELRDYRFYAADMVHPSETASEYILERFAECYFTESTKEINKKILKIINASKHRAFNPETPDFKKFRISILNQILELNSQFPYLDFEDIRQNISVT